MRTRALAVTLALAGVVALGGCSDDAPATASLSAADRAEIAAAVTARHRDLLDVWAKRDAFDAWMALYAAEDNPAWTGDHTMLTVSGHSWSSRAEIDTAFRKVLADRTTQVEIKDERVAVLSPTSAVDTAEFVWTLTRDGKTSPRYAASATIVWVLEGSEWKILHYHQSWPSTTPVEAT